MDRHYSRMSFTNKGQRRDHRTKVKGQSIRYSDVLTQRLAIRTSMDLQKGAGHLAFTDTLLDLLRDPVCLGMKGGFRGSKI